jgi:hypothetical protein
VKVDLVISPDDERRYAEFVNHNLARKVVLERISRNIRHENIDLSRENIWHKVVGCLITTQQRSGPESRVSKFLKGSPSILSLASLVDLAQVGTRARDDFSTAGLRRANTLAVQVQSAAQFFTESAFADLQRRLNEMSMETSVDRERSAARFIQEQLVGFGPKQSRNLIQWLGVSQFEIPLDSRMMKVLKRLEFPIPLSSTALADEEYYCFVEDALHAILTRIEVKPCIFDACAFASFERA